MSFTAKTRVSVEEAGDGQKKLTFSANYSDPNTGERVNTEWAKYTPGYSHTMWVLDEVVERNNIQTGDAYLVTFTKE